MTRLWLLAALALAACDAPAPRVDTEGQAMRAEIDRLTKVYADCVSGHADAVPLPDQPASTIVAEVMKSCRPARTELFRKVAAFDRFGHPKHSQAMADAVAQASVATLDDDIRQAAVVTIFKRQQGMAPTPPAGAAKGTTI